MATEKQIPAVMGQLVKHQRMLGDLSSADAQWAHDNPDKVMQLLINGVKNREREQFWEHVGANVYFPAPDVVYDGPQWAQYLHERGHVMTALAANIFYRYFFKTDTALQYDIALLRDVSFPKFFDEEDAEEQINRIVLRRSHMRPSMEVACMIRDAFSDQVLEMLGIQRVYVLHRPVQARYLCVATGSPSVYTARSADLVGNGKTFAVVKEHHSSPHCFLD